MLISNGDHGVEGHTEISILPGSALYLSCNATGTPRPSVNWIRAGYYPIDPAWVHLLCSFDVWTSNEMLWLDNYVLVLKKMQIRRLKVEINL